MHLSCKHIQIDNECIIQNTYNYGKKTHANITHTMLIIGLLLSLRILLLKLSHILTSTVSLCPSPLNICLAQIVVEWALSQLYASSSTSFSSFMVLLNSCLYVALAAFHNKSLMSTPGLSFIKLLHRCMQQILCSYCGKLPTKVWTNPCQE